MDDVLKIWKPTPGCDLSLDPCPFCGGEEVVYMKYQHAAGERWRVVCCGCTATIDPGYCQQRNQVQPHWNRRAGLGKNEAPGGGHYKKLWRTDK